ncbi:hypothetical protein DK59_2539 [Brucella abortus bv. 4 str. 292]|nr:hypothetical protein DK59_2539 [Brucella abortus bv. 4 str. 292]
MRTCFKLGPAHEHTQRHIADNSAANIREKKAVTRMAAGNIYNFHRLDCKRDTEVIRCILPAFHGFTGNGPDIAVYLALMDRTKRPRPNARQDKQAHSKMRNRVVSQGRIKGRDLLPRHGRDILGFMALLTEKGASFFCCLQINVQTKGRCMPHAYGKSIDSLPCGFSFRMPDRRKRVANILLINIGYRNLAEFRQNMMLKRAEPATSVTVALQFSFPALKCINCHIFQQMQIASSFTLLAFALFDWIDVRANHGAPLFSGFTRLFQ